MQYPKKIKSKLRKLADTAYEKEVGEHLLDLSHKFDDWKNNKINIEELNHFIHQYHQGPARKIYSFYNSASTDIIVAKAIAEDRLAVEDIPVNVLESIQDKIEAFKNCTNK